MNPEEIQFDILEEGIHDQNCFKAIFCCGSPGSGKTTIERNLGLEVRGLKSLNADNTMFRLKNLRNGQIDNRDYPHAGETTEKRFNIWRNDYLGLILNTTGRNLSTISRLNTYLTNSYYDTFMLFVDVDKEIATGLMYLKFLTTCEWFKHTAILAEIINIAEECMSDNDDDEKQAEEIPKKKEPKEKKNKKINVKINDPNISKIVDFE